MWLEELTIHHILVKVGHVDMTRATDRMEILQQRQNASNVDLGRDSLLEFGQSFSAFSNSGSSSSSTPDQRLVAGATGVYRNGNLVSPIVQSILAKKVGMPSANLLGPHGGPIAAFDSRIEKSGTGIRHYNNRLEGLPATTTVLDANRRAGEVFVVDDCVRLPLAAAAGERNCPAHGYFYYDDLCIVLMIVLE